MDSIRISPLSLKRMMDKGEPVFIVDARNPIAWRESEIKIPGAVRMPVDDLDGRISEIPKNTTVVFYCT